MNEFRGLDSERDFLPPQNPFLLLTEDMNGTVSYSWWNNEKEFLENVIKRKEDGERILYSIEIASYRNIDIPSEYTVDDFIISVNSAYDDAKSLGFDSIVLAIETDAEQTYYINDTEDGFQCDVFDYYFDDLNSIAEALFNEEMIRKSVEIRIE